MVTKKCGKTKANYVTYNEVDAILEVLENETNWLNLTDFIPTVEELKENNVEENFRNYAPFIIYLIEYLSKIKNNKTGYYKDDQIDAAKESYKYLNGILSSHTVENIDSDGKAVN